MVKRERRGGRATLENWHKLALELDPAVKNAKRGKRDEVYREFAERLGTSVSVPRRMVQALRFLHFIRVEVGFAALADRLAEQPLASLVILDRWSQYAPDHALAAAERLVDGQINLPMVEALEREDRATGERVLGATDSTWQVFAATRAVRQVVEVHAGARCIWAARGWRPEDLRLNSLKLPGRLGELPALPGFQLAFELEGASDILLVSIISDRVHRTRTAASIVQIVMMLLGYAGFGYRCLLMIREPEDATAAKDLVARLDNPAGLAVAILEFD